MGKIKISAISYLNTLPFVYGINRSEYLNRHCSIHLDIPSVCADKLISGKADIGIVPVAVLPKLKEYHIISDFCIGADSIVRSVLLLSCVPLGRIKKVYLDYQSRTSVVLVKILADKYWFIKPEWITASEGYEKKIKGYAAGVVIGDRSFELYERFPYVYDFAAEWKNFSGLPFVFACWIAIRKLNESFLENFNRALSDGIKNIPQVINECKSSEIYNYVNLKEYFTQNISYDLNADKRKGMELFLSYLRDYN